MYTSNREYIIKIYFNTKKKKNEGEKMVLLCQPCLIHIYMTHPGTGEWYREVGIEGMKLKLGKEGRWREGVCTFDFVSDQPWVLQMEKKLN